MARKVKRSGALACQCGVVAVRLPACVQGDSTVIIGASAAGLGRRAVPRGKGAVGAGSRARPQVAEAWRRHYDRLHLHTTRDASALPYVPMPSTFPTYPGRLEVIDYLEDYAARLKTPPRFNETVTAVEPAEGGVWYTRTPGQTFVSNNVVVATGHTRVPVRPTWPGLQRFGGPVIHSSDYRSGHDYASQSVLVIGFGNSAAEIAIDLHEHGAHPTLAVRGAVNVIPRDVLGIPDAVARARAARVPAADRRHHQRAGDLGDDRQYPQARLQEAALRADDADHACTSRSPYSMSAR